LARIILSHALLESIRFVMSRKECRDIYGLINMSPEVNGRLKALAAANQRSVAWIINYAIEDILEKYEGEPTPQLPVCSSPKHGQ
jgi:hypothetical protein